MMAKCLVVLLAVVSLCSAGVIPAAYPAALTVGTYASSYNAHAINHAIATPYVASAAVAAPAAIAAAPYVASAPYVAAAPAIAAYSPYSPYIAFRR